MFFLILNAVICGVLIYSSFTFEDKRKGGGRKQNPLVNVMLLLGFIFLLMTLCLLFSVVGPHQLVSPVFRLGLLLMAWCSTACWFVMLTFSDEKKHSALNVFRWVLNLLAAYIVFVHKGGIVSMSLEGGQSFRLVSGSVLSGALAEKYPVSWYDCYYCFYLAFLPVVTALALAVKAEATKDRLLRQNIRVFALGAVASVLLFLLLWNGRRYQEMFNLLMQVVFLPQLLIFLIALNTNDVWGKKLVLRSVLRFVATYIAPAVVEGVVFMALKLLFPAQGAAFYVLLTLLTAGIVVLWVLIGRRFAKAEVMRDGNYADAFEKEILSINYEDDDPKEIVGRLRDAFKKYVDAGSMRLAVDASNGFLETVFADDEEKLSVPMDAHVFDALINLKHPIVFREYAERDYGVATVRPELLAMLDDTKSEAFIVLNEGRHVMGVIFLGKKESGNRYNDYDYAVFTRLYSSLFVVGYFMKNILNESVVGTVNREIRMSAQIITSIQENMDYLTNPKIDCGYRMIPAHNIGGEFVDLIRLNDTRHLFVIGALSGKGIAASMSMVILKSIIRTNLAETKDFKVLIQKVNTFIRDNLPKGTFFAGMFGLLDFNTDTMYYINCGSPALFMYTRTYNNVIEIQGEGHVLGFAEDISKLVRVKKTKLAAGDIILACTDGLIESRSLRGENYGKTRVQSQIMENAMFPADKMAQFTYDALVKFSSKELDDDITILVMKYNGDKAQEA